MPSKPGSPARTAGATEPSRVTRRRRVGGVMLLPEDSDDAAADALERGDALRPNPAAYVREAMLAKCNADLQLALSTLPGNVKDVRLSTVLFGEATVRQRRYCVQAADARVGELAVAVLQELTTMQQQTLDETTASRPVRDFARTLVLKLCYLPTATLFSDVVDALVQCDVTFEVCAALRSTFAYVMHANLPHALPQLVRTNNFYGYAAQIAAESGCATLLAQSVSGEWRFNPYSRQVALCTAYHALVSVPVEGYRARDPWCLYQAGNMSVLMWYSELEDAVHMEVLEAVATHSTGPPSVVDVINTFVVRSDENRRILGRARTDGRRLYVTANASTVSVAHDHAHTHSMFPWTAHKPGAALPAEVTASGADALDVFSLQQAQQRQSPTLMFKYAPTRPVEAANLTVGNGVILRRTTKRKFSPCPSHGASPERGAKMRL